MIVSVLHNESYLRSRSNWSNWYVTHLGEDLEEGEAVFFLGGSPPLSTPVIISDKVWNESTYSTSQ